jgi:D-alanyl-D-alanine carboxypeptidase (penicillin-binding protein 5/6)
MQYRNRILYILFIALFFGSLLPVYAAEGDMPHVKGAYPQTVGKAALLMDASSGRVLYQVNAHQRLSPASVTKIMSGLLSGRKG